MDRVPRRGWWESEHQAGLVKVVIEVLLDSVWKKDNDMDPTTDGYSILYVSIIFFLLRWGFSFFPVVQRHIFFFLVFGFFPLLSSLFSLLSLLSLLSLPLSSFSSLSFLSFLSSILRFILRSVHTQCHVCQYCRDSFACVPGARMYRSSRTLLSKHGRCIPSTLPVRRAWIRGPHLGFPVPAQPVIIKAIRRPQPARCAVERNVADTRRTHGPVRRGGQIKAKLANG